MKKILFPLVIVFLASGMIGILPAEGYVFYLDDFKIVQGDASVVYEDNFSQGKGYDTSQPPQPRYFGAAPFSQLFPYDSEVDGKLKFDSQYAVISGVVPMGYQAIIQNERLNLNLLHGDAFTVTALFDLIEPKPGETYSVRLYDSSNTPTGPEGGFVELTVRKAYDVNSSTMIQFRRGDYYSVGGKTYIDRTTIDETQADFSKGYDQIALNLIHGQAYSSQISASFIYYDKETNTQNPFSFLKTSDIFHLGTTTASEFQAAFGMPVPEPATMLLLVSGLAGLAGLRRRFRKN